MQVIAWVHSSGSKHTEMKMSKAQRIAWLTTWLGTKSTSVSVTCPTTTATATWVDLGGNTRTETRTSTTGAQAMSDLINAVTPETSVSQGYAAY